MPNFKWALRYMILVIGVFFMGLGVSLTTKSNLGTSPISSLPYVLSMIFPVSLGQFTFLLSIFFILVQVALLGKRFPGKQYLQILVGAVFGLFVDLGMALAAPVHPRAYLGKLAVLLMGCVVLALGVYLQVVANVIINPGEGVVRTLARTTGVRFGTVKIMFDATLLGSAVLISCSVFGTVRGVREGAVITALLVGCIVNGFSTLARHNSLTSHWLDCLAASA